MSVRNQLKLVGVSSAALAVAVLASPAVAAPTDLTSTATYSCFSNAIHPPVTFTVTPPTSTSLIAGQKESTAATVHVELGPAATGFMLSKGWDHFTGTVTASSPSKTLGVTMTVPTTAVGAMGSDTPTDGTGTVTLDYPAAGTFDLAAGDFTATLQGYAGGVKTGTPAAIGCVAPTDGSTVLKDSTPAPLAITVAKDASKSTVKASYSKSKKTATATATVKGAKYKLTGTGSVKFTLKKGTHKVKTVTVKLSKGTAKASFKKLSKKGSYTVTTSYAGSAGLKASTGKATFKIK